MDNAQIGYAGFWRRAGALMIDNVFFALLLLFLVSVVHVPHRMLELVYQPICLVYFALLESSARQATFGKSFMKIYVATEEGRRLPPWHAIWRYLVWVLPLVPAVAVDASPAYIGVMEAVHGFHVAGDHAGLAKYMAQPGVHEMMMTYVAAGAGGILVWALWCIPSMIFSKKRSGVHDLVTGTRVFRR